MRLPNPDHERLVDAALDAYAANCLPLESLSQRTVRAMVEAVVAEAAKPSHAMISAAWDAWRVRHSKLRLGPGPAFREAIEAAIAAAGVPVRGEEG